MYKKVKKHIRKIVRNSYKRFWTLLFFLISLFIILFPIAISDDNPTQYLQHSLNTFKIKCCKILRWTIKNIFHLIIRLWKSLTVLVTIWSLLDNICAKTQIYFNCFFLKFIFIYKIINEVCNTIPMWLKFVIYQNGVSVVDLHENYEICLKIPI